MKSKIKYIMPDKNGQKWIVEQGFSTIYSNIENNIIWKIYQMPFVMISSEKRYSDGKIMKYATYESDYGKYNDERKKEVEFIKSYCPVIFNNDRTGEQWCFDTKLPTGRWLENITVSTDEKGKMTFYAYIEAIKNYENKY